MRRPKIVTAEQVKSYIGSDSVKMAALIRDWAKAYFVQRGSRVEQVTITTSTNQPDGGCDGIIVVDGEWRGECPFATKVAMQFKTGRPKHSDFLDLKEEDQNNKRISDAVKEGFQVVWVAAAGAITGLDNTKSISEPGQIKSAKTLLDSLVAVVTEINPNAPTPLLCGCDDLADWLCATPGVVGNHFHDLYPFKIAKEELAKSNHSRFPVFVHSQNFDQLSFDIHKFFQDSNGDNVRIFYGTAGTGKTRSILEVINQSESLKNSVLYFSSSIDAHSYLNHPRNGSHPIWCVIDEYFFPNGEVKLLQDYNLPLGSKILAIGHSYWDERLQAHAYTLVNLSEAEISEAISKALPSLSSFQISIVLKIAKNHIRMAYLCGDKIRSGVDYNSADFFVKVVESEFSRIGTSKEFLQALSLVNFLTESQVEAFCKLFGFDQNTFNHFCRNQGQHSGVIQYNDHVRYVGIPAIRVYCAQKYWNDEQQKVMDALRQADALRDNFEKGLSELPEFPGKVEMLEVFFPRIKDLTLSSLMENPVAESLLRALRVAPEDYLPAVLRIIRSERGALSNYSYHNSGSTRFDLLFALGELAQFEEHFEYCEEICYLLAKEESDTTYSNNATSYWSGWFTAWFDQTVYPYEKRLAMLKCKVMEGDENDIALVLKAIAVPFPKIGNILPRRIVGGRRASPSLDQIDHEQKLLAQEEIPKIYALIFEKGSEAIRDLAARQVCGKWYEWISKVGSDYFLDIPAHPKFPEQVRDELIVSLRTYLEHTVEAMSEGSQKSRWLAEIQKVLTPLERDDIWLDALALKKTDLWIERAKEFWSEKLQRVCAGMQSDSQFRTRVLMLFMESQDFGGRELGNLIGENLSADEIERMITFGANNFYSNFSQNALATYFNSRPQEISEFLKFLFSSEQFPAQGIINSLSIFGEDIFYLEATRILPLERFKEAYFRAHWFTSLESLKPVHWSYFGALGESLKSGQFHLLTSVADVCYCFSDLKVDHPDAIKLGEIFLGRLDDGGVYIPDYKVTDIITWLLPYAPELVIDRIFLQDLHSTALVPHPGKSPIDILAEVAFENSEQILNRIAFRIEAPYKGRYVLGGTFNAVLAAIDSNVFDTWIRSLDEKMLIRIAGHLPLPDMVDSQPYVSPTTECYWNFVSEGHPVYERASNEFLVQGLSFMISGYGQELFRSRITFARRFLNHKLKAIRDWADGYIRNSERSLQEADKDEAIDKASDETS
jgi:hypothetical protein